MENIPSGFAWFMLNVMQSLCELERKKTSQSEVRVFEHFNEINGLKHLFVTCMYVPQLNHETNGRRGPVQTG